MLAPTPTLGQCGDSNWENDGRNQISRDGALIGRFFVFSAGIFCQTVSLEHQILMAPRRFSYPSFKNFCFLFFSQSSFVSWLGTIDWVNP